MALNANALTSLATAKTVLSIPTLDITQDSRVERLINASSGFIEKQTDRLLKTQTITEFHDGRRFDRLILRQWPISSITSLRLDNSSVFTDPSTLVDTTEYVLENDQELVLLSSIFPIGNKNIKIVYVAGYITVSSDLEDACLKLIQWWEKMETNRDIGTSTKSKQDENITLVQGVPEIINIMLEPYKRRQFVTTVPINNS